MTDTKHKHMDFEMRSTIQMGIREKKKLKEIAQDIGKDPTTVSKELQNNRYKKIVVRQGDKPNRCANKNTCKKRNVCGKTKAKCSISCKKCRSCNERCPDFELFECKKLNRFPYVCNVCENKSTCTEEHFYYSNKMAQGSYEEKRNSSRTGISLTPDELQALDELVSPALKQGHSLEMIYMEHQEEISVSIKTVYNYIAQGLLTARNIDCRRLVVYRKRKGAKRDKKRESEKKKGHEYEEFLKYSEAFPDEIVWEMDTVEGVKGGKMFMTMLMRGTNFMLMYLIESKEQENTVHVFDELERILGHARFREIFQVVLTDNGCEFADPGRFETGLDGERRTRLFYCEPGRSDQKGTLEKNHEYIRYILPKGTSFDDLDEEATLKIMNNINSVRRKKLDGKKPVEQMKMMFGNLELEELGIVELPQDEVTLRPKLVR